MVQALSAQVTVRVSAVQVLPSLAAMRRPELPASPHDASQAGGPHGTPYTATIRRISPRLRERMQYSHRPGCPVPLSDLRYLQMTYLGFDRAAHTGEMVVHEKYAAAIDRRRLPPAVRRALADPTDASGRRLPRR
jgi:hypothetical protein